MADSWATSAGNGRFVVFCDVVAEEMHNSSATMQGTIQATIQATMQGTMFMCVIFGDVDVEGQ